MQQPSNEDSDKIVTASAKTERISTTYNLKDKLLWDQLLTHN